MNNKKSPEKQSQFSIELMFQADPTLARDYKWRMTDALFTCLYQDKNMDQSDLDFFYHMLCFLDEAESRSVDVPLRT